MKVTYPKPAESLSRYVQAIMIIENQHVEKPFLLPLFANGTPTLLFSTVPGSMGNTNRHLTLFGQTIAPDQLLLYHAFKLIAYFLKPYALSALFNLSACELTDQPLALDLLAGTSALQEQLLNATTTDGILQRVDQYLYQKITVIPPLDKRLTYAAEKIAGTSDKNILTTVQQELHVTERTFQRMFKRHIGVSPNLFRRINQFNRAFRQINDANFSDLSAVAYHNGYADQSHFIRTFKAFTHDTPSSYLRRLPDA